MISKSRIIKLERVVPKYVAEHSGSIFFEGYSIDSKMFREKVDKLFKTYFGFKNQLVIPNAPNAPKPGTYARAQELLDGFMTEEHIKHCESLADKPLDWWHQKCLGDLLNGVHRIDFDLEEFGLGQFIPALSLFPDIEYTRSTDATAASKNSEIQCSNQLADEMSKLAEEMVSAFRSAPRQSDNDQEEDWDAR